MLSRKLALPAMATAALFGLGIDGSAASSPQAWEEFRRDVESACRAASETHLGDAQIVVDPFGSQSYGLALLTGPSLEDGSPQSLICVYDKASRTVEVGGVLALERTLPPPSVPETAPGVTASSPTPTGRLLSPEPLAPAGEIGAPAARTEGPARESGAAASVPCDGVCPPALDRLTPDDRAELFALPAQIERTVAAGEGTPLSDSAAAARAAALAAARSGQADAAGLQPFGPELVGGASCTLYYFGFEGEAARTVGTHQCRVSEAPDGRLRVEKTSGERLRADLEPLRTGVAAFLGRSFEEGAERQAYDPDVPQDDPASDLGNTVGLAVRTQEGVYLMSSQRRRFDPSDNFFWVLAIERS